MSNPKLGEIFKEMEIAIIKLMQKLEIIPENVSQYMLQATQQRSNEPAGQNPLGGMMPGSNPMEMLQMQQMAQFQQMQQMMMNKK